MNVISYTRIGFGTLTLLGMDIQSNYGPNPTYFQFISLGVEQEHTSVCLQTAVETVFDKNTHLVRAVSAETVKDPHIYLLQGTVNGLIRHPRGVTRKFIDQMKRAFGRRWMELNPKFCWSCHKPLPDEHGVECPHCRQLLVFD